MADRLRVHREVVSFARRGDRMTTSQRKAWSTYRDRYLIDVERAKTDTSIAPGSSIDLAAEFGRVAPLIVEIGHGNGDSLVPMAKARSGANVLGFEVFSASIAGTMIKLAAEDVDNVRLIQADAVDGLQHVVGEGTLDRLWMFFPDPWHKNKHRKRRLVSPEFADLAASRLRPGGMWRIATDWSDYATHIRDVLDDHPAFDNPHPGGWAPRWSRRPVTRFEQRGIDAGRRIFDLTFVRR